MEKIVLAQLPPLRFTSEQFINAFVAELVLAGYQAMDFTNSETRTAYKKICEFLTDLNKMYKKDNFSQRHLDRIVNNLEPVFEKKGKIKRLYKELLEMTNWRQTPGSNIFHFGMTRQEAEKHRNSLGADEQKLVARTAQIFLENCRDFLPKTEQPEKRTRITGIEFKGFKNIANGKLDLDSLDILANRPEQTCPACLKS